MDLEELLELLQLESPEEFAYFENFADLVENDEEIPEEALFQLFSRTDPETVAGVIGEYFEHVLDGLPDEETDLYLLLEQIRRVLRGAAMADDDNTVIHFTEEVERFHRWYCFESSVACEDRADESVRHLPLRDALSLVRAGRLYEEDYDFDFSGLEYELSEYSMQMAELAEADGYGREGVSDDYDGGYDDYDDSLN